MNISILIQNTPFTSKREESEAMIESLTSRLSLSLSLNQQLKNQLLGSEATIATLTSQLNKSSRESYDKLSEVEKRNKLLSGDHDTLSNTSLEQCDELILTLSRSQEKLQQRRVSDEATILITYVLNYCTSSTSYC